MPYIVRGEQPVVGGITAGRHPDAGVAGELWTPANYSRHESAHART